MASFATNPHVLRHAWVSAALFFIGLVGSIFFFYLVLIRPFSAGFDLVSVGQGEGVRASTFTSANGTEIQNQLRALTTLVLGGEYAGSFITLDAIEQHLGEERPFLYGLEIQGQSDEALIIGLGRPGQHSQTYILEEGISAESLGSEFTADTLTIDENQRVFETRGPTYINGENINLATQNGIRVTQGGDIEIR